MAQVKCNPTPADVTRRTLLRTSAVAIGAALLPRTTTGMTTMVPATAPTWATARAEAQRLLSAGYLLEVARIAEELKPGFLSGTYRGWRDEDDGRRDSVVAKRLGLAFDPDYRSPRELLDDEVELRLGFWNAAEESSPEDAPLDAAFIAIAASSDWLGRGGEVLDGAVHAVAQDVIKYARARHWYAPTADEEPADA
jgi:hypothetical protein